MMNKSISPEAQAVMGMTADTLADHLRRMRAHGRVYVQHDGHGTIGAVWSARRTT